MLKINKQQAIILVCVIIAIVAVVAYNGKHKNTKTPKIERISSKEMPYLKQNDLPINITIPGWPAEIPMEKDAPILRNYQSAPPGAEGRQITRMFRSAKTAKENYKIYDDFFKANGWTEVSQNQSGDAASLAAEKDNNLLTAVIYQIPKANVSNVSLTFAAIASAKK